jgi:hypothetical protein
MKAEILAKIKTLSEQESVLGTVNEFNDLVTEFYKIQDEEERQWEIAKAKRIEEGEKPESIEKPIYPLLNEFKLYSNLFKEKKKVEITAKKDIEKANLSKKRALIAALSDLVQNEENIGRAIGRYKDIQDSWKAVGPIPRDKRQEVQQEFSHLVDTFQYNINIYKEIKDHDLTRNFKLKEEVIANLKQLLELDKIKEVEKKLHAYQEEWTSIGGTHQEDWEKIKDDYWATVNKIYEKIHAFYDERRAEQAENIVKKKALIEKAKEIASQEVKEHNLFKKLTDELLAIQEDWKKIGYGPKQENETVWEEFRGVCNTFFDKKQAFYDKRNEKFSGVKEAKEALIEKAIALKDSTDWKTGTQKIIALQKEWKAVGSAGPKFENKLWKKFREPIDLFFQAKDEHFAEKDAANIENLEKKKALIAKIEGYEISGDPKSTINDLRALSKEFAEIGNVPFKQKDEIYAAYKKALDAKYNAIKMDKGEKEKMMFQARLDTLSGSANSEELLDKERYTIRTKIDGLKKELNQLENNMSFFANADESNPLLKNALANVQQTKDKIEAYKTQLKLLRQPK